jgi:hypothetical protein
MPGPAPVVVTPKPQTALTVQEPDVLAPAPEDWSRHLEPRSMREATTLATYMHDSRMFLGAYGTPQAILATILAGRELGLQAMASLRAFHIIDNKPTLSADFIRALVLRSPLCEFFRCTERTAERATFTTQRRGDMQPVSLTYTIEDGRKAWTKTPAAWDASSWGHNPADMCVARASSKLARLVYPDVVLSFYAKEEFD